MNKLVVLIPFYNEEKKIENIKSVLDFIYKNHENVKFIFCNDNSNDQSELILQTYLQKLKYDFLIIRNKKNLGHGGSLIKLSQNFEFDNYSHVLTIDFDYQYKLENLKKIFEDQDSDIVIGKRKYFDEGLFRQILTSVSEAIIFLKTLRYFKDTNCPIRLYKVKLFEEIWSRIPIDTLVPNIFSTYLAINQKLYISRHTLSKNKLLSNESVSWGNNFFLKKIKLIKFAIKSSLQIAKFNL